MADKPDHNGCGVTGEIADFTAATRYDGIPGSVVERGKAHMLDTLGLALSGAGAPASRIVRDHIAALGASGDALIMGTAMRTAPRFAALANGTAMHADNFDDTNPQPSLDRNGGIHASGAILPAVLALAETGGKSGKQTMTAFQVGTEVACKLNHAIAPRHYDSGFHSTGTLNSFGCAAAAANLLNLDAETTEHALASVAARAGGVRANFGAMVEQLHPGQAAECGIVAVDLAARGLGGVKAVLETRFGWFEAAADGYQAEIIHGRLGNPWALADPGTWIKPFPNGALTHTAMTLMFKMVHKHTIEAAQIARIDVHTNQRIARTLLHNRPENSMQAKFSMPFALAIIALDGKAGLLEFTDETLARDDLRAMIERVEFTPYDKPGVDYTNVTSLIEIHLTDGTTHEARGDFPMGSGRAPMSFDEIAKKALGCAAYGGWPEDKAGELVDAVRDLENLADISDLTRLLAK